MPRAQTHIQRGGGASTARPQGSSEHTRPLFASPAPADVLDSTYLVDQANRVAIGVAHREIDMRAAVRDAFAGAAGGTGEPTAGHLQCVGEVSGYA